MTLVQRTDGIALAHVEGPWVVERPEFVLHSNTTNGSPDLYSVVYDEDEPDHTARFKTMSPCRSGCWPECTRAGRACKSGAAVSADGYTWRN